MDSTDRRGPAKHEGRRGARSKSVARRHDALRARGIFLRAGFVDALAVGITGLCFRAHTVDVVHGLMPTAAIGARP